MKEPLDQGELVRAGRGHRGGGRGGRMKENEGGRERVFTLVLGFT